MAATTIPEPHAIVEQRSLDSAPVLKECCDRGDACRFQLMLSCNWTRARFCCRTSVSVELEFPLESALEQLLPNALCSVSFPFRTSLCAFLGHLVDTVAISSDLRRVVVTVPEKLAVTNLRQAFRVPIVRESGLETTIRLAHPHKVAVWTNDITDAAINVELTSDTLSLFSLGATVHVELKYRGEVIEKRGRIHRLTETNRVIILAPPTTDDQKRQATRLQAIILSLQQLWLKSRLK